MPSRILPILLGAVLLTIVWPSSGAEWTSTVAGMSFRLPSDPDWDQIQGSRAEAKLTLARADGRAAVVLITIQRRQGEVLNEEFVKTWEKSFYSKGRSVKVSGEFFTFKGQPAYKLIDRQTKDDEVMTRIVILWLRRDRVLEIAATKREANPFEDPVIKEFIDSMKVVPDLGHGATSQQGGTNGRQPSISATNQTSAAAASRRSP
jgi:hypothetical protein